ncbi:MAG TPA: phytase [Rhabdochlamydiaceae bacterium]|nr:phytase [Rhabdochlamydiaceae bacterium]
MHICTKVFRVLIILNFLVFFSCSKKKNDAIDPAFATSSVQEDADDCAIWIHPTDRSLSLIIGNDNEKKGGLYLWDFSGKEIFRTEHVKEPMHMDVRYGMRVGNQKVDIVACPIRGTNIIKVFKINPDSRTLTDITTTGGIKTGFSDEPYGFCLYKDKNTGNIYAFLSKNEAKANIHQILLEDDGSGQVMGSLVRSFGGEFTKSVVEGMCADDDQGFFYMADQHYAVLKFDADPTSKPEPHSIFATDVHGLRKGLSLYTCDDGKGYILLSTPGDDLIKVYEREGENHFVQNIEKNGSSSTDGIDSTSCAIPPKFPYGFLVCHNKPKKNFVIYSWEEIARDKLLKCNSCP